MINSRLLYIEQTTSGLKLAESLEKVDEVLGQALYTERVDGKVYIYGHQAEQKIFVGREVIGREEDLYHHETVKLCDYSFGDFEIDHIDFNNFSELFEQVQIKLKEKNLNQFRLQVDLDHTQKVQIHFFNNREK